MSRLLLKSLSSLALILLLSISAHAKEPQRAPLTGDFLFSHNFNDCDDWTIIDANNDGSTWEFFSTDKMMKCGFSNNREFDQDDWLISPAISLETDKYYEVTIDAKMGVLDYGAERFEMKAGKAATAEAMTINVIAPTDVHHSAYKPYTALVKVTESGTYHFGIHAIAPKDRFVLWVDNFGVSQLAATAPAALADVMIETPADGSLGATITYSLPQKDVAGNTLTDPVTAIDVYINGYITKTITDLTGSWSYNTRLSGAHSFRLVPRNSAGIGKSSFVDAFLGINRPGEPGLVTITEPEYGTVDVSWEPPTKDYDGYPIHSSLLTYDVYATGGIFEILEEGYNGTSYSYTPKLAANKQIFLEFTIWSRTAAGMGLSSTSRMKAVGVPYTGAFDESFESGEPTIDVVNETLDGAAKWDIVKDGYINGVYSVDHDGGFAASIGNYGGSSLMRTLKYICDEDDLALSFYYYTGAEDSKDVLSVGYMQDEDFVALAHFTLAGAPGWHHTVVDFSSRRGLPTEIAFKAVHNTHVVVAIDDVHFGKTISTDLAVASFTVPESIVAGSDATIGFSLSNQGFTAVSDYEVLLFCNGENCLSFDDLPEIAPGETYTGSLTINLNSEYAGVNMLRMEAECTGDEHDTNNSSGEVEFWVETGHAPVAVLAASGVDGKAINLRWQAPDISQTSLQVTEGFEDTGYKPFAIKNAGDWTMGSTHNLFTTYFGGYQFPNQNKPAGWILFNTDYASNPEAMANDQILGTDNSPCFMASFEEYDGDNEPKDCWLISPCLNGAKAQTVTFMARTYLGRRYGNGIMDAWYSTSGSNREDFVPANLDVDADGVGEDWRLYSFDIPEGTNYFALRDMSVDSFILFVDDITFCINEPWAGYEITGYDIYRNNRLVDSVDANTTTWTDTNVDAAKTYRYRVVTRYNLAEGAPSNECAVSSDALTSIFADNDASIVSREIYSLDGRRLPASPQFPHIQRASHSNGTISVTKILR